MMNYLPWYIRICYFSYSPYINYIYKEKGLQATYVPLDECEQLVSVFSFLNP